MAKRLKKKQSEYDRLIAQGHTPAELKKLGHWLLKQLRKEAKSELDRVEPPEERKRRKNRERQRRFRERKLAEPWVEKKDDN